MAKNPERERMRNAARKFTNYQGFIDALRCGIIRASTPRTATPAPNDMGADHYYETGRSGSMYVDWDQDLWCDIPHNRVMVARTGDPVPVVEARKVLLAQMERRNLRPLSMKVFRTDRAQYMTAVPKETT